MLTAREALCPFIARVTADQRPSSTASGATVYAVFAPEDKPAPRGGEFLGLVTRNQIAPYPERIFADLLPRRTPIPAEAGTPVDDLIARLDRENAEAITVEERGAFLGAVTRASLLSAVLRGELTQMQAPSGAPAPTESLHEATLRLLGLLTTHELETELLQQSIETLTALLKTRYGAIGIVDAHGALTRFVHNGIPPEQAARIGQLPQGRGLLGVVIQENQALRLDDMAKDPRSAGLPAHHPPMKSLLAVPISYEGRVYGRLYFSDKLDAAPFSDADERLAARSAGALALTLAHHRLQSEARQGEAERHKFASVIEQMAGSVIITDREGVIEYVNPAFERITGYTRAEAVGKKPNIVKSGKHGESFYRTLWQTILAGKVFRETLVNRRKNGELYYEEKTITPLKDAQGRITNFVSTGKDISERVRAEQALRANETRLAEAQRMVHLGNWDLDLVQNVLTWSPEIYRIFEIDPAKFGASYQAFLDAIHPDDRDRVSRAYTESVESNTPYDIEHRLLMKGGRVKYVHERGESFYDGGGKPLRSAGTVQDITERKQAEEETRRMQHFLDSVVENLPNMLFVKDAKDLKFVRFNKAAEELLGYARAEMLGQSDHDFFPKEEADFFTTMDREVFASGELLDIPREPIHTRHRGTRLLHTKKIPILDEHGRPLYLLGISEDITERVQAEDTAQRLGRILDHSTNEIYVFCADSLRLLQVNQGAQKNLGYSLDELRALTPLDLKPDFSREGFEQLIAPLKSGEQEAISFITNHRRKDGSRYPVEVHLQLSSNETPPVFVAIVQDITERKHAEERLSFLAYYDTLTGLPNRQLLRNRLRQTMFEADRNDRVAAVMLLDLDRFKFINDTLGHEAGDMLLKGVAERLTACVRHGDTVARLGGDEFTVVLANVARVDDVAFVTQKILEGFKQPFTIAGRELFVSPSIGITLYPHDDRDIDNLLKNADAAMYHAKESGRNTFQFFTAELNERAAQRLELETALRHALERDEFLLHYQPLMDLKTGQLKGVEALLRWRHPQRGLVPPLDFIPLAEETGLIVPIGEWVLRTACAQAQAWHAAGFCGLHMAVNISGRQFQHQNLTALVGAVLAETGLEPQCFNLELTESVLMHNVDAAIAVMSELDAAGVGFSIDDFGTGYSSLSYLKRFPIDVLKIDRSFVRDITTDLDDAAIVTAIMALARTLDIQVVAEGVETEEQLAFLRARGCDVMQGYYFSKPLDAAALTELLKKTTKQGKCTPRAGRPSKPASDAH